MAILLHQDPDVVWLWELSELNLQVEAERSYHQTVLATLEKLSMRFYNKDYDWNTFSTCLLLELDDYGEEMKRVFRNMFAFLPHPRMQIQMDLTIMDMQIKMVHTLLQK
ncbi:hypothetical protein CK203_103775 [Vitis vinifera]|uniref:Uncharacterized protein n=1 Tax=Vitis vinifera TaxID=29760 RepID=A0A438CI63_VITVI|nr:hypothetical protein CK203_103775 [Vitis vinifera]